MIVHVLVCDGRIISVDHDIEKLRRLLSLAEETRQWHVVEIQSFEIGEIRNSQLRSVATSEAMN